MTERENKNSNYRFDRRKILAGLGAGAAAGLAGCSGGGGDGGATATATQTMTETTMGGDGGATATETETATETATETDTGEIVQGGKPTIGLAVAPTTLNPLRAGSVYDFMVIDRVFTYGTTNHPETLDFKPWLVTDWTLQPSEATSNPKNPALKNVTIRDDLTFHDGEDLTADDLKFSIEYYRDKNPTASLTGAAHQVVTKVEKQNDVTVDIYMNQKEQRWFTNILGFPVLPQHIWSEVDDFTKYVPRDSEEGLIGSGAWKLNDFNWQNWYELETVDDYPIPSADYVGWLRDEAPFVDGLRIEIFGSQNAMEQALLNGDIDAGFIAGGFSVNNAVKAERSEQFTVHQGSEVGYNHVSYNLRRTPLDDVAFRQFLNKAMDKKWIVENPYQGIAAVQGDYVVIPALETWRPPKPEDIVGQEYQSRDRFDPVRIPDLVFPNPGTFNLSAEQIANVRQFLIDNPNATHDYSFGEAKTNITNPPTSAISNLDVPDRVKGAELYVNGQHLTEAHTNNAGEGGQGPLQFSFQPPQEDLYQARTGQQYVGLLKKIGIPIEPKVKTINAQIPTIYGQEDFDIYSMGWGLGVNVTHLSALYSSQGADLESNVQSQKFNPMGYTGADDLIKQDRQLMDFSKRFPIVKQICATIFHDAPTNITDVAQLLEPTNNKWKGWIGGLGSTVESEDSLLNIHQTQ